MKSCYLVSQVRKHTYSDLERCCRTSKMYSRLETSTGVSMGLSSSFSLVTNCFNLEKKKKKVISAGRGSCTYSWNDILNFYTHYTHKPIFFNNLPIPGGSWRSWHIGICNFQYKYKPTKYLFYFRFSGNMDLLG